MNQISQFSGIFYFDPQLAKQGAKFKEGEIRFTEGRFWGKAESIEITDNFIILTELGKPNQRALQTYFPSVAENQAALIRSAFLKWGVLLTDVLTGEFAIVIWERKTRRLWAIRDRFGFIPLYYQFQPDAFFCFSDRIDALPTFTKELKQIDVRKVRNYLSPPPSYQSCTDRTFYAKVKAALPGHRLQTDGRTLTNELYWQIDPKQYREKSTDEYVDFFRTYFIDSIERKTKDYQRIGAHLSGGIDSSSVACVVSQFHTPISTFHVDPGFASTDETFFVNAVLKKIQSRHYELRPQKDIYGAIRQITTLFDRPEHLITPSSFQFAAAAQAKEEGCEIILTGHDGDSVTGHGNGLIESYWQANDWTNLNHALKAYASARDLVSLRADWLSLPVEEREKRYKTHYLSHELWQILKQKQITKFTKLAQIAKHEFGFSYSAFMRFVLKNGLRKIQHRPLGSILTPEMQQYQSADEVVFDAEALYEKLENEYKFQFRAITNQAYIDATEELYYIGRQYGHQYIHPFFDEKLVELSLAIPEKVKFGDGKGRETIRLALKGILPEEVRTRGFKTSFSEYGVVVFNELFQQTRDIFTKDHSLWEWVDRTKFLKMKETLLNTELALNEKTKYISLANRVLFLGVWLENLKEREEH